MLWETEINSVKVVFITVLKLATSNLILITSNHCLSILLHRHLDFMKTLKLQTLKTKLVSFFKPFNQFSQELHHHLVKVVRKLFKKLLYLLKKEHLNPGLFKTFTKNIQHFMKKVWIQSWFKNWSDTTNFFNWWLKQ